MVASRSILISLHRETRGLTLVELLLGVFLAGVVVVGLVKVYADAIQIWQRTESRLAMQRELAAGIQIMEQDIRQGQYLRILSFHGQQGNHLKIYYNTDNNPCNEPEEKQSIYFHPSEKCVYRDKEGQFHRRLFLPMGGKQADQNRYQLQVVKLEFDFPEGAYRKSVCSHSREYLVDFEVAMTNKFDDTLSVRSSGCCRGD